LGEAKQHWINRGRVAIWVEETASFWNLLILRYIRPKDQGVAASGFAKQKSRRVIETMRSTKNNLNV
jgi:hypothetical protein